MDDQRFDRVARAIATGLSRRRALGLLVAGVLVGRRPEPAAAQAASAGGCASGLTACGGACVDLLTDLNNCGACGSVCQSGLVPVRCRDGICERASCPVGITYCGAVDGCRDLVTDPAHCGACQSPCASGVCAGGVCAAGGGGSGTCAPGQADCGGVCIDTCCDNANCGACGNVCPAGRTCFEGVCDCPSGLCCAEGEANCGGVCVATCCDNNNCGACGNVCPRGQTCFEGVCGCPSGACGPVQLPNTGSGPASSTGGAWAPLALAGAGAALLAAARWLRDRVGGSPKGDAGSVR